MNAADGIKKLEQSAAWKRVVTPRNILIALVALGVPASCYLKGRHDATASHAADRGEAQRWTRLVDSLSQLRDSTVQQEIRLTAATTEARKSRATAANVLARVRVVGPTEIALDGGTPQATVPASRVVPIIAAAHEVMLSDSVALATAHEVIDSQAHEIALQSERVDIAEAASSPRFGLKTGVALGAAGLGALLYGAVTLIRVFK